ncbi:MAG: TIGR02147 family protein [Oligoflexales bacterium]
MEISIFDFTSHSRYLEAIYNGRKKKNSSYSLRKFSQDLGFSSSRYATVLIEATHKFNHKSMEKICVSLKLDNREKEYFSLLVKIAHSNDQEKVKLLKRAQEINKNLNGLLIDDSLAYYLENNACRHITLLVQIFREDFIPEPLWIARFLKTEFSLDDIRRALDYLIKNQFIKKEDGIYINSENNLVSKDEIPSKSIKKAHKSYLEEAIQALDFGINEREYGNISVPIHSDLVPELKNKIKKTRDEFKAWVSRRNSQLSSSSEKSFLAVSVNFQMYPIVKTKKESNKN